MIPAHRSALPAASVCLVIDRCQSVSRQSSSPLAADKFVMRYTRAYRAVRQESGARQYASQSAAVVVVDVRRRWSFVIVV